MLFQEILDLGLVVFGLLWLHILGALANKTLQTTREHLTDTSGSTSSNTSRMFSLDKTLLCKCNMRSSDQISSTIYT